MAHTKIVIIGGGFAAVVCARALRKRLRRPVVLRSHIIDPLEKAEPCADPERRKFYLSFVIIGGGFSGVELAGEVNDLIRASTRFYRNFTEDDISVILVHSKDQVLPEVSPTLRDFTLKKMQRAGIKILLKTSAAAATPDGVGLPDGSQLRTATVVCTIGTTPQHRSACARSHPFLRILSRRHRPRLRRQPANWLDWVDRADPR